MNVHGFGNARDDNSRNNLGVRPAQNMSMFD